ncbi:HlyD family efflux transporter periplasmic adaptor subunit [Shewanella sp. Isolate13]|uniref:HlyD family efflux transporter periplasmic adaptor subunit n=1 Tax=Shewanella sp. Isolate13 TaxID=2908531 RepID=UPI001EFCEE45|nr:HlyD family efflux transporter periplasmic adaptor subunit [Shewanella sp. Isolate13]MCG9730858.1 HlyD family efflux transporter periplasmic adaptor subunit [Shewanella sp. Isolate13]
MKMTHVINAIESPFDGVVTAFFFEPGELVSDGELLAEVEPTATVAAEESA